MSGPTTRGHLGLSRDISKQARKFLEENKVFASQPINADTINAVRKQNLRSYQSGIDAVVKAFAPDISTEMFDGIKVQVVTPRDYMPANYDKAILYFFGGGFCTGSPEEDLRIIIPLAEFTGIRIYAPWYPLAPEYPFPTAFNEALMIYRFMVDKLRPRRIAVVGESAGGNLAFQTVLGHLYEGVQLPAALGLLSPWCDLELTGDSHQILAGVDPTLNRKYAMEMADCYSAGHSLQDPRISPLQARFDRRIPPTFISSGTRDYLMSDAVRLASRLRSSGVTVDLNITEGMWHVFEFFPELPEARQSLGHLAQFLIRHLDV